MSTDRKNGLRKAQKEQRPAGKRGVCYAVSEADKRKTQALSLP